MMADQDVQAIVHWARRAAIVLVAALAPLCFTDRAEAQWGYGFDPAWWGWVPYQTPSSVNYLNERAALAGQNAALSQQSGLRAPARAPRDVTFFERFDAGTRASMEEGIARRSSYSSTPATPRPAPVQPKPKPKPKPAAPARPRPILPLNTFFDQSDMLVWPADAPTAGDLASKREHSDKATLVVLRELTANGFASVASATEARSKLRDYGRPALEYIRKISTTRVADTFHLFLLSLYDSIGQAVNPPKETAKPAS